MSEISALIVNVLVKGLLDMLFMVLVKGLLSGATGAVSENVTMIRHISSRMNEIILYGLLT